MLWQKIRSKFRCVLLLFAILMVVVSSLRSFWRLFALVDREAFRIRRRLYALMRPFWVLSLAVVTSRLLFRTRKITLTPGINWTEFQTTIYCDLLLTYQSIVLRLDPSDCSLRMPIVRAISLTELFPKLAKRLPWLRLNVLPVLVQVIPVVRLASPDQVMDYLDPRDA